MEPIVGLKLVMFFLISIPMAVMVWAIIREVKKDKADFERFCKNLNILAGDEAEKFRRERDAKVREKLKSNIPNGDTV